jgi:hypothetical protein
VKDLKFNIYVYLVLAFKFLDGHRHKELCRQGSALFSFFRSDRPHLLCLKDFEWHFYDRQLLVTSTLLFWQILLVTVALHRGDLTLVCKVQMLLQLYLHLTNYQSLIHPRLLLVTL